ncbi:MAG: GHMP kinase [Crenarchaeota archaeon]|nr:GHMP kinase [Thermoproteota archaeon]
MRSEPVWPIEVPLHVTAFWKPVWRRYAISTGSLGAGVLLEPGALCRPSRRPWPPIKPALRVGAVECRLPAPVGKGYATSAAVTLAASLGASKSFLEAVAKAHVSEVLHKTGLGDVMAIAFGRGIAVRERPGGPGWGYVVSLEPPPGVSVVAFEVGGPFADTPSMLSSLKTSDAFERAWRAFSRRYDFWAFLEAAEQFSEEVGFAKRLDKSLLRRSEVLGGYVKKSVAVLFVESRAAPGLAEELGARLFSIVRNRRPFAMRFV